MWYQLFDFMHFIGLIFGVGGATAMTIMNKKAKKKPEIFFAVSVFSKSFIKLVWWGIFLLIVSGIALPFFIEWELNKELLIIKHILVLYIIIIGILLFAISKKIDSLSLEEKQVPSKKFLNLRKTAELAGKTNLFLWYFITFISVFI